MIMPLLVWALLELYYFQHNLVFIVVVLIVLIFFFTARQFVITSYKEEGWYNFVILPTIFTVSLVAFTTMIPVNWIVQILFFSNTVFLYLFFRTIYYFLIKTESYEQSRLENIAAYGNFLAYFFMASSVYGLQAFLNLSTWAAMLVLLISSGLIIYQMMWSNAVNIRSAFFYILVISLVLFEIAWSASFLSLSYYVLGLILAVCYYVLIGLVRFYLTGRLDKKIARIYIFYGLLSIILVLLTARWL